MTDIQDKQTLACLHTHLKNRREASTCSSSASLCCSACRLKMCLCACIVFVYTYVYVHVCVCLFVYASVFGCLRHASTEHMEYTHSRGYDKATYDKKHIPFSTAQFQVAALSHFGQLLPPHPLLLTHICLALARPCDPKT